MFDARGTVMVTSDLAYKSAVELADLIRGREISPREVIRHSLERIADVNPALNCFCFVFGDEALDKARDAERAVMEGKRLGPLHGVPVAIKDLTPTRGKRTTMGSRIHEHWVPDHDAIVVERLMGAGAIMVGKTTTPEFAHTFVTESPLWGVTRNPWHRDHTPGGSSGGSAAAVATGCVPIAEGSDMGGSVRTPASFCGLVGLKPSFGRIPFEIFPSVFDQTCHFGPLSRTIDDAALFLKVAQGPDERDMQSLPEGPDISIPVSADVRGLKIAYSNDLGYCAIDAEVEANLCVVVDALRDQGAEVREVDPGLTHRFEEAGWAHWDAYYATLLADLLPQWRDMMDPRLVQIAERGLAMSATDLKRLEFVQTELWQKLLPILSAHQALICPTTALPAPRLGDTEFGYVDEAGRYRGLELTFPFNLVSRCPALAVPSGFTAAGLPTSVQIVGRRFDDLGVLRVGAAVEKALNWTASRPPL